jgi:murein L,D-transpeptidase YafK
MSFKLISRLLLGAALLAPMAALPEPAAGNAATGLVQTNYTPGRSAALPVATRVVVYKSARKLELLRGNEVLRTYKISLGLQPVGHKERSGDFRTPEGRYALTRRNPRSDFFLSIQVSYPGPADLKRAKENGWDPGGSIMIHGMPNRLRHEPGYYQARDWTDGCIAVSNSDMVEIWLLTQNEVPIDILP